MNSDLSLYFVTPSLDSKQDLFRLVEKVIKGGVTTVQYRDENISDKTFLERARSLQAICKQNSVTFLVNNRVDIALAVNADGVHLGQDDMPVKDIKSWCSKTLIVGLSIENFEQLEQANTLKIDYVAASPVFSSPTKTCKNPPFGLDGLEIFVERSKWPVVAIGGISRKNLSKVCEKGVCGVAMISAIANASDVQSNTSEIFEELRNHLSPRHEIKQTNYFSETKIIDLFKNHPFKKRSLLGIGDDCAILKKDDQENFALTSDLMTEGVHFTLQTISPFDLGAKSLLVSLSDLLSMGAVPHFATLSLALPKSIDSTWLKHFSDGLLQTANDHGIEIIGGDTTKSLHSLFIDVQLIGTVKNNSEKRRSEAKIGDIVAVTDFLGDSKAGLECLLENIENLNFARALCNRHLKPKVPSECAKWLSQQKAIHASMDISDGLMLDGIKLAEASKLRVNIDVDRIPISKELKDFADVKLIDPFEYAVLGGEDYCLLLTIDSNQFSIIQEGFWKNFKVSLFPIGNVSYGLGLKLKWHGQPFHPKNKPFEHFQEDAIQ